MTDSIRSNTCTGCIGENSCEKQCPDVTLNRLERLNEWDQLLEDQNT